MMDVYQIFEMQKKDEGKIALKVRDFALLKVDDYYDKLFAKQNVKGTILSSYTSYGYGLENGTSHITQQDVMAIGIEVE